MKITEVIVEHYDRGIPLKNWGSVEAALNLYASGRIKSSRATEANQMKAVAESNGAMGLGFYLYAAPHMQGAGNQFVERMLAEAKATLKDHDGWHRSYDYDGIGAFFKTGVDIAMLDRKEDLYMLEIYAAYVGDEPELRLAEDLGIPRALRSYSVTIHVEPEDATHFAFNFGEITQALGGVLEMDRYIGEDVANNFMSGDRYHDAKPWRIFLDKNISLTLGPGRVEGRFVYDKPGEARDTWTTDGPTLYGLLHSSFRDESKKDPPTIVLTISSIKQDRFGYSQPIWDLELKSQIDTLSNQIANALRA